VGKNNNFLSIGEHPAIPKRMMDNYRNNTATNFSVISALGVSIPRMKKFVLQMA
jgi:hypothetical protein